MDSSTRSSNRGVQTCVRRRGWPLADGRELQLRSNVPPGYAVKTLSWTLMNAFPISDASQQRVRVAE
jgi:hypothetical protein